LDLCKLSDYELVEKFIKGSQTSIETLINRHRNRVYTYIYLIVKNQQLAEDIFQDTFIKVVQSLKRGKYTDNGKFLSWVIRIAHNLIIDHFRREKQFFNSRKLAYGTIEDEMVQSQIITDVRGLIDELPADQREVVMLRHYGGLSFKEIAEHTNVSINTALGRMRYALINLRKLIGEKKLNLTIS